MDLYADNILDHYKNPKNHGSIDDASVSHNENNPICGDNIALDVLVEDGGLIDLKFSGAGCAISQASMSLLSEKVKGMKLEEIEKLDREFVIDLLHIPISERRIRCALLSLLTLKNAVSEYLGKERVKWSDIV